MSETNLYLMKQVWRQKGDAPFDRIPFKEANKAQELSQTTRPVLLLETKTNGGCGAVFAVGRVTEAVVQEEAVEYPNGEYLYHVPFAYEYVLADKKNGITREELQDLSGQKFAPQAKGGLWEVTEAFYEQVTALLQERNGAPTEAKPQAATSVAAKAEAKAVAEAQPAAKVEAPAASASAKLMSNLRKAIEQVVTRSELRFVIENDTFRSFPSALLNVGDLVEQQRIITEYVSAQSGHAVHQAADEAAATSATATASASNYAKVIALVERLVLEGRYATVQAPTEAKAFYRDAKLPNPYLAFELSGKQGHHVLGVDGTLYTLEGKTIQHFLGL